MSDLKGMVNILKGAGEITRLRLLALLSAGELTVKDLTDILGQSQPRISRHLKLLADAGLVERHSEGAWAYFRLSDEGAGGVIANFVVTQLTGADAQISQDVAALQQLRSDQQKLAESYFATVADRWDALRKMHVAEDAVEAAILDATADLAAPDAGAQNMLDLGTGTGRMLELLAGRYVHGVGIDSSLEMLAVARSRLTNAQIAHAQVRLGDLTALDVKAHEADLISIHQVLHYFDDPALVLSKAAEALSARGRIVVVDFAPHALEVLRSEHAHRRLGISEAQMANWAQNAGLEISRVNALPPEAAQAVNENALTVCLWVLVPANRS